MSLIAPLALLVVTLFVIGLFMWAHQKGMDPLALLAGMFLAAGVILGIYAMSEARGASNAEAQTSALLGAGLLVSGALLLVATRRSRRE
jgi:RsiW-degrading membrane proteinase PrsW (M82 family)